MTHDSRNLSLILQGPFFVASKLIRLHCHLGGVDLSCHSNPSHGGKSSGSSWVSGGLVGNPLYIEGDAFSIFIQVVGAFVMTCI